MIKTLLFDFGDVFLNLDKKATARELTQFNLKDFTPEMWAINKKYEKGLVTTDAFTDFYLDVEKSLSKDSFVKAWNSILIDFPNHRLDFIKNLKKQGDFKLILLSNTNELHIEWVKNHIAEYEEFKACFDQFYLSHEVNFRKPDAEIFEFILSENQLQASETLFIDDTKEHTSSAAKLGINVWHLDPEKDDVTELFTQNPNLF
ncbi:MAG: HAD family phosphatase [Psychroflexus sp.]|nr:HAD family phosphatase [Psychroflexus sp.]MDN6310719.1 HAD family phosphatase [Psychroflexus sp.]